MNRGDRVWRRFEGDSGSSPLDAEHWIRVYTELRATLVTIAASGAGEGNRIEALVRVFDHRLRFWEGVLHNAPVRAARDGDRRRSGGGRTRSA